jgi:DNA replication protein DnaC
MVQAIAFRRRHHVVPERYRDAILARAAVGSVLLTGPVGSGKTWQGYAILAAVSADPRVSIAAYSWTAVLAAMRAGYGDNEKALEAEAILCALEQAGWAMLDDVGAEKLNDKNQDWIRETLFRIIDQRYMHRRPLILTTNLEWPGAFLDYAGKRLFDRVREMCAVEELAGPSKRGKG